nr:hypothetical protein REQ54_04371 [Rhizobium sp. Q54]
MPNLDDQPSALNDEPVRGPIVHGAKDVSALACAEATQTKVVMCMQFVTSVIV